MHIANLREDSFRFIQWMSELAQRDEILGDRKSAHTIPIYFHDKSLQLTNNRWYFHNSCICSRRRCEP